jgi:L-galactose dehydrogenase
MEYRKLGQTDLQVSTIGFGASPLGNEFGPADADEGARAVHLAIDCGVNFFDVSPYDGRTLAEERLGRALQGRRGSVVLATKCGRYGKEISDCDYSASRVTAGLEDSLRRLRTDHVDLLQVHDIEMSADPDQIIGQTIPALRKLQQSGKCRAVGITGLPLKLLGYIAARVPLDTILSFCHYNLMADDMDQRLTPLCRARGIGLINAAPLHMGILTEKGPPDWHPASDAVKSAGRGIVKLCQSAGVSASDVALRFCLDHPYVSTTVVGMCRPVEIEQNLRAMAQTTDPALLEQIAKIVAPVKNQIWLQGRPENNDAHWTRGQ